MRDIDKTKAQLINELAAMRQRISELETSLGEHNRVEQALRESEERFRALIENALDAIVIVNTDGTIRYQSSSMEGALGRKAEERTGKSAFEFSHPDDVPNALEAFGQLMKNPGSTVHTEVRVQHKDGSWHTIEVVGQNLFENPAVRGIVGNLRDITERKQAEEALRESEERFRALIENALDAIVILNSDVTIRYESPSMERMTGRKAKVMIGRDPLEFSHPDDIRNVIEAFAQLLENRIATVHTELRLRHRDGSWRTFEVVGNNLLDNPAVAGIVLNLRDITERKQAEEELIRLSNAVKMSTDIIVIGDLDAKIVDVNEAGLKMYGAKDRSDLIGKSSFDLIAPEDRERAVAGTGEVLEKGYVKGREYDIITKDGSRLPVEMNVGIMKDAKGKPVGFVGVSRDITERKRAEEALRESEERLRTFMVSATDSFTLWDSQLNLVEINEAGLNSFPAGTKKGDVIGKNILEIVPDVEQTARHQRYLEVIKTGEPFFEDDIASVPAFGDAYFSMKVFKVSDGLGIIATDITERKKAEEALRASEHNYRLLFESTIDGTVVIDAETMKVVLANQTAAKMHGFASMEEVVEANLLDYIHPDDRDRALKTIAEDLFEKDLRRTEEFRTLTKDGREMWIAGVGTRVEYQGRLAGLISFRDITEQKRTDERLRELYEQERESRQRVEAEMKRRVEFTRALAHELKNPLTSVLASSDLLTSELHDEPLLSLARNIAQGASSLNSRIDELLDLARGEVGMLQLKLEPVDLLQLLRDTADSMRPLASSRAQSLSLDLPPSLPPVRADGSRVQQVVTNLLGNAFKFTPVAGSITLRAKVRDAALVVEVRDTGRGMSKEEQKQLFEPYHRLHSEPSGGLGLGLALCKTLVELHGGQIWVRSNVGRGSTFGFSLPLGAAEGRAVELEKPTKLWKVLIIEDDQEIVSSVSVAFQMRWPEAQLISSSLGEEGLELVETENPDLVILDLGLPDISGFEVLREIRLFSSVPVVILTVQADEADMVKGLEWGADDYVVKPFRQMELLARLKVQLRKQIPPGEEAPIICGSLHLDPSTYQLTHGGREISLTIVEGRIMQYLMQNAGHVVTHSRLAEAVWGEDHAGAIDSLRVYIRYLREKLEEAPSHPQLILTKVGIGYLLAKPA